MAFTIDPVTELLHAFKSRTSAIIVGLTTGKKVLSPGRCKRRRIGYGRAHR